MGFAPISLQSTMPEDKNGNSGISHGKHLTLKMSSDYKDKEIIDDPTYISFSYIVHLVSVVAWWVNAMIWVMIANVLENKRGVELFSTRAWQINVLLLTRNHIISLYRVIQKKTEKKIDDKYVQLTLNFTLFPYSIRYQYMVERIT